MMVIRSFFLFVLTLVFGICVAEAKDTVRDSVVKIHSTQRPPDFHRPWTKSTARKTSGSGVVIEGARILTNWHVVQYASQLFVQLNDSTDKLPAVVVASAPGMDMALVQLEDAAKLADQPALPIADQLPAIRDTVNVYGFPLGGDDMSVTEGIVSRIDFSRFAYDMSGLRVQVDAALNPGNSGGPAVIDGQVVGLVFSKMNQAENIGYLIPAEEIKTFLSDIEDGAYDGKPTVFDRFQSTENVALRARLRLPDGVSGYMVRRPDSDDSAYPLKQWDVITQIGEYELDSQGNVRISDDLRLDFRYLIPRLTEGDAVVLKVFRDGQSMDISVPIVSHRDWLVPALRGDYPRHFIFGPLVFTAATQEFVANLGPKGYVFLSAMKSPLLYRQFDRPRFAGEELVVMANRMFPHRITKGYMNAPLGVVRSVNQQEVHNLPQLVELIRDASGEFITFEYAGEHEILVFRRAELAECTEDILSDEGIRYQFSADLRDVWETGNSPE